MSSNEDWETWKSYLFTASRILAGAETQLQAEANISLSDFDVLVTLHSAPDHSLSMSCLKETVLVTTSGLSRSVSRLHSRGWLLKESAPHDKRQITVTLTPEGKHALLEIQPIHYSYVRERFFEALSAKDQRALGLALTHLSDHLLSDNS